MRGYAICTSARSGSNFLSQVLASTGVLGRPLEYFNGPGRRLIDFPDYPDDPFQQCDLILSLGFGATPNGVYGLKIFPDQAARVAETHWPTRLPNLHFLHFQRRDLLGQALSRARAKQTKQWRSTLPARREPIYDRALIEEALRGVESEHRLWRQFFSELGVRPLDLIYEEVVGDPQSTAQAVADFVGVDGQVLFDPSRIDLQVQRDDLTAQWRERYLSQEPQRSPHDQL